VDPLAVKPTPKIPINTETPKKKPRLGVPPPQASVATKNQSRPSLALCRWRPSSSVAMEEDSGGGIITMEAKDQRENLSLSRREAMKEEAQGGDSLPSLSMEPECRRGNHRRDDRLHQHHHPHLFYVVRSPAPRCNPLFEPGALCHIL